MKYKWTFLESKFTINDGDWLDEIREMLREEAEKAEALDPRIAKLQAIIDCPSATVHERDNARAAIERIKRKGDKRE